MDLFAVREDDRVRWNAFVAEHVPAVGAFLQSWEWGEFRRVMSYPIKRCAVDGDNGWIAALMLEEHELPLGFTYQYAPRGPVIAPQLWSKPDFAARCLQKFERSLRSWFHDSAFVRLEPSVSEQLAYFFNSSFRRPYSYVQPRFNSVVVLREPEADIFSSFSRDMRHDLRAAERRGVSVTLRTSFSASEFVEFCAMQRDTSLRAGKNIYPGERYYEMLFSVLPPFSERTDRFVPSIGIFTAYYGGQAVAMHIVVFFADTATYLFGASYSGKQSSKATSLLHWFAMREAKRCGFRFYDLGGIDPERWPSLTYFKSQFNGSVVSYLGNVDLVLSPVSYAAYNLARRFRYSEK